MKTENSVEDGKLTDEQLGKLQRKFREIERSINEKTISFDDAINVVQNIIIEGKAPLHLGVIKGTHEIKMIEHLIDCDAAPFIPDGWSVENHKKGGLFKFNPAKISFYLSEKQKKGDYSVGNDLREELDDAPVLNANVLDYLLAHPELIPEEWKGKAIFFWGTIYRSSRGGLCVRFLRWGGSEWDWIYDFLGNSFGPYNQAALAS